MDKKLCPYADSEESNNNQDTHPESDEIFLQILKIREEQIEGTRQKPQWIVTQGYSRTYNSRMQQSRLQ